MTRDEMMAELARVQDNYPHRDIQTIVSRRAFTDEQLAEHIARYRRNQYCTHPEQAWCDCDWCRVVRAQPSASAGG